MPIDETHEVTQGRKLPAAWTNTEPEQVTPVDIVEDTNKDGKKRSTEPLKLLDSPKSVPFKPKPPVPASPKVVLKELLIVVILVVGFFSLTPDRKPFFGNQQETRLSVERCISLGQERLKTRGLIDRDIIAEKCRENSNFFGK